MSRYRHVAAAMAIAITLLAMTGCNQWATFPPIEVTPQFPGTLSEPMPTLMAESIRFAHERYGDGTADFAINLPPDAGHETYSRVTRKLGGGHPMTEFGETAYHVLQVRTRGGKAEVDVVYPRRDSIYELVTVTFSRRLVEGWVVLSSRLWRIRVEVPGPNYVAPPPSSLPAPGNAPAEEGGEELATELPDEEDGG